MGTPGCGTGSAESRLSAHLHQYPVPTELAQGRMGGPREASYHPIQPSRSAAERAGQLWWLRTRQPQRSKTSSLHPTPPTYQTSHRLGRSSRRLSRSCIVLFCPAPLFSPGLTQPRAFSLLSLPSNNPRHPLSILSPPRPDVPTLITTFAGALEPLFTLYRSTAHYDALSLRSINFEAIRHLTRPPGRPVHSRHPQP